MNNRRMLLAGLGSAALLPVFPSAADSTPVVPGRTRIGYFPNAVLETHEGKKVKFYDDLIKNKVVVINMMYAACTRSCPANTASLVAVQEHLGKRIGRDIFMYSLTLQPDFDNAQALRDYVARYGIKPGWTFLTGKRADMELIRRRLGFYDPDPAVDANPQQHTGMVRIGNERFDRWSMAPAIGPTRQIVHSILNAV